MLIEIIIALLLGCTIGTFTGLIPGIHINLIGVTLVALSFSLLSTIQPIFLIVFIVAMAITHTFLDFIPSIFLGCPDTDTELSVLPGHDLLKKGKGYEALLLTNNGSIAAILILLIIFIPAIFLIDNFYGAIKVFIPYILILVSITLIALQKNKVNAIKVFLLTGLLGFLVLNINLDQSLLPLLTGLFGASSIIISLKNKTKLPKQILTKPKLKLKPVLGAAIAAPICSFLPGLGSGQAAIIGNTISKTNKQGFLTLLGATNTLVMAFSFLSLYTIEKTRTGAALALKKIIDTISTNNLVLIMITILLSAIISYFLTKKLAKFLALNFNKINYTKLSITTLIILILLVLIISGPIGLLILIVSTITGIYSISLKVKRTNMMGCLLIPTIILFLF